MIYKNQIECGNKILYSFLNETKYCILIAQMQSGKTGVCKYVIEQIISYGEIKSEEIYFICGINDTELRNQIIFDLKGVLHKNNILFSKQLNRDKIGPESTKNKFLPKFIIIDESHYAGLEDSQIDKFLELYYSSDIYLLSISATPMGEIASLTNNISIYKKTILLEPDINYYGINDIFEEKRIFQSANLNGDINDFINIIDIEYNRQNDSGEWKYGIVRLNNKYYFKDLETELEVYDIKFINHHNEFISGDFNFNSYISKPPKQMTIIWIYNTLRAGKQLDTTNIGFIHDSYNTLTDTTAQSLLGRVCGYNKQKDAVNCYVDIKAAYRMLIWIKYKYDIKYIPIKSKNILNGQSCNQLNWKTNVPIFIELAEEYKKPFLLLKHMNKDRYPYKNKLIAAILNSAYYDDSLYYKIHKIITNYTFGKFGGLMVLSDANAYRSFNENWNYNYKAYLNNKPIKRGFEVDKEQLNSGLNKFYYIFCNLNIKTDTFGSCLIIYKKWLDEPEILAKDNITISDKSRFSKEIFG